MNDKKIIDEIRQKVDIVDVVSSYIPLTQKGKNFFGVCPFHDDTNPSMSVSREKQIYRCFSCGASGNVFNFVMDYEHLSFKEVIKILGEKANVNVSGIVINNKPNKNQKFYDAYQLSNKFYQNNLNTLNGKSAKEYLKERSIDDSLIKEFGIGLALKNYGDLTNILLGKGYNLNLLNLIGLSSQDRDVYIDRIMFPLTDTSGRVVGFSGRIYKNQDTNKYLNTKETPIFKKGELIYHYFESKDSVRLKKEVIVMEGFMDVIRACSIGFSNTIALMGTAMTKEQASLIKRLSNNIILCFDGDSAGQHANLVNGEQFEKMGINVKVIELHDNFDPDTYILKYGALKFKTLVDNAINYQDYKISSLRNNYNLSSDEEKVSYINSVLETTSKIEDEIHREIILKKLAIEVNIGYNTLEKRLQAFLEKNKSEEEKKVLSVQLEPKKTIKRNKYITSSLAVLYYMLIKSWVIVKYDREGIYFPEESMRFLASEISYYYRKYGTINLADFYTYLNEKEDLLSLYNEVISQNFDDDVKDEVIIEYINVVREGILKTEIKRLEDLIRNTVDPLEKARIAEKIRCLKIGS